MFMGSAKEQLGCWLNERWSTEIALRFSGLQRSTGPSWLDLKNRHEKISIDSISGGRVCHWRDSSALTVARVFPRVGARILQECLSHWPVSFERTPAGSSSEVPEVSFVVAVRGTGRLGQFQAVMKSLSAQCGVAVETVVVEQSSVKEFESFEGLNVRYLHTPVTCPDMPFNRSWALNAGAVEARGRIIVILDADMVVPTRFAAAIAQVMKEGVDVLRLSRLMFYLDRETSELVQSTDSLAQVQRVERVVQNTPNPMAILRDAYMRIGGHDESFYGWGGEDNEFLDRIRTLRISEGGFLPIIHLWHADSPSRGGDRNANHLKNCLEIPVSERIELLTSRQFGQPVPSVRWEDPAKFEGSQ